MTPAVDVILTKAATAPATLTPADLATLHAIDPRLKAWAADRVAQAIQTAAATRPLSLSVERLVQAIAPIVKEYTAAAVARVRADGTPSRAVIDRVAQLEARVLELEAQRAAVTP